jgi:hypothetical protein
MNSFLTEQELRDYWPDFIDALHRDAAEVASPLHCQGRTLARRVGQSAEAPLREPHDRAAKRTVSNFDLGRATAHDIAKVNTYHSTFNCYLVSEASQFGLSEYKIVRTHAKHHI